MRKSTVVRALAALITLASLAGAQASPAGTTTVILVRHAEKAAEPSADPPLTSAGAGRAKALADLVKDAGVNAIISTQFQRTRLTVAPTATKLRIQPEILDARLTPRATADSILAKHRGQTVLVVGHSNTIPAIVAALGAPQPADICDAGYDNAYVVTVPPTGPALVTRLHYGAVSAPCPR
jgi:broad specificity phosphatase PhoE